MLVCSDSDAAIRALLAAYPEARDVEIAGAGLDGVFVELTGDGDETIASSERQSVLA